MSQAIASSSHSSLPPEVWKNVFSSLGEVDLRRCLLVCKMFSVTAKDRLEEEKHEKKKLAAFIIDSNIGGADAVLQLIPTALVGILTENCGDQLTPQSIGKIETFTKGLIGTARFLTRQMLISSVVENPKLSNEKLKWLANRQRTSSARPAKRLKRSSTPEKPKKNSEEGSKEAENGSDTEEAIKDWNKFLSDISLSVTSEILKDCKEVFNVDKAE